MRKRIGRFFCPMFFFIPISLIALLAACLSGPTGVKHPPTAQLPEPGFVLNTAPHDPDRPARKNKNRYEGPIIDTHVHILNKEESVTMEMIQRVADIAGLDRIIFMPVPNEGIIGTKGKNAEIRDKLAAADSRFGQFCGSGYLTVWMNEAYRKGYSDSDLEKRLNRLRADIDSGRYIGIGEIGPYHYDKKPGQHILQFSMNFEPFLRVAEIAAEKGVWLDVHAEPVTTRGKSFEAEVFGGIDLLYDRYPNLKLILSHTAMTNAQNARRLLETYPNLMFNMKIQVSRGNFKWDHLGPITNHDLELYEDWARLMEDMPERFMIGSDGRLGERSNSAKRYAMQIRQLRDILGSLRPDAADMIARQNAIRLLGQ